MNDYIEERALEEAKIYNEVDNQIYNRKEFKIPALSIGQMMNFLSSNRKPSEPFYFDFYEEQWYINNGRIFHEEAELVDVLWIAVKEIL